MRLANVDGRAVLVTSSDEPLTGHDVATASGGRFGPDLASVYADWDAFAAWARGFEPSGEPAGFSRAQLGPPSPRPAQVVAIGFNYSAHAAETGFAVPDRLPPTFTKFVSCLTGPDTEVVLPEGGHTDWEVEIVAVIGRTAHRVGVEEAWDHVAGLTVGQDLSERLAQMAGPAPQFSLAKSLPGFGPTGPWLVTPDELPDRDDLELGCSVDGEVLQRGRSKEMIFSIPALISGLSATLTLQPGDLVFTGTPDGVGMGRDPQRYLAPGQRLRTWVEGIGELRQRFV